MTPKRVDALVLGVKAKRIVCGKNHNSVCTEDGDLHSLGNGKEE